MNQIIKAGNVNYKYDKNGNLIEKDDNGRITKYVYDYDNRLIKIIHPDGSKTEYKYDYLGRRIQKIRTTQNAQHITHYIYSGWQVIAEVDGQGKIVRRYIYGANIDEPLMTEVRGQKTDITIFRML